MKGLLVYLTLCVPSILYADIGDVYNDFKEFTTMTTKFKGILWLEEGMQNGDMVVAGDIAKAIWNRAVRELGEPLEKTDISQLTNQEFIYQDLEFRGWSCAKVNPKTIRNKAVQFVTYRLANLSGNVICERKIFDTEI